MRIGGEHILGKGNILCKGIREFVAMLKLKVGPFHSKKTVVRGKGGERNMEWSGYARPWGPC